MTKTTEVMLPLTEIVQGEPRQVLDSLLGLMWTMRRILLNQEGQPAQLEEARQESYMNGKERVYCGALLSEVGVTPPSGITFHVWVYQEGECMVWSPDNYNPLQQPDERGTSESLHSTWRACVEAVQAN